MRIDITTKITGAYSLYIIKNCGLILYNNKPYKILLINRTNL